MLMSENIIQKPSKLVDRPGEKQVPPKMARGLAISKVCGE